MVERNGPITSVDHLLALDDASFIAAAYQAVLGRAPDPTGLNHYLSKLAVGVSREEIFDQLCRSREAKELGVKVRTSSWLKRTVRSFGRSISGSGAKQVQYEAVLRSRPTATEVESAGPDGGHARTVIQLGEQLQQVRDLSEGLVHAVQGLHQATSRHEQVLTALQSSGEHKSEVENEVVTGLGLAIRSFESVLKRHEKSFVSLRSELNGRLDRELDRIQSELGAVECQQLAQAKTQAEVERVEARMDAGLAGLQGAIDALADLAATRREPETEPDPALAAFEKEQERIADIVRSFEASSKMMGLKIDVLDQKSHWLSVDNDNIRKRIEFIRKEILLELRRAISQHKLTGMASDRGRSPRRLDPGDQERTPFVFAAGAPKRVNLGCGHLALDGFANLDARDLPGVDIVADLRRLPFDPASIDELRATHVIEHFTEHALLTEVLPHWASVLRPGGTLTITAPDAQATMAGVVDGTIEWETAKTVLMGGQEYEGDFHFALLDPATVCSMLEATGFTGAQVVAEARQNGDCLEFEIVATR